MVSVADRKSWNPSMSPVPAYISELKSTCDRVSCKISSNSQMGSLDGRSTDESRVRLWHRGRICRGLRDRPERTGDKGAQGDPAGGLSNIAYSKETPLEKPVDKPVAGTGTGKRQNECLASDEAGSNEGRTNPRPQPTAKETANLNGKCYQP